MRPAKAEPRVVRRAQAVLMMRTLPGASRTTGLLLGIKAAEIRDTKLRDEALRAAESAVLNIAEGAVRLTRADKRRAFTIARGEGLEASAALETAALVGDAEHADVQRCLLSPSASTPFSPASSDERKTVPPSSPVLQLLLLLRLLLIKPPLTASRGERSGSGQRAGAGRGSRSRNDRIA